MDDRRVDRSCKAWLSGSWWRRRSLQARLTAAAALVVLVSIVEAAALLVVRLRSSLVSNLDAAVTEEVDAVASDAAAGPLPRPLPSLGEVNLVVQVVSSNGRVLTTSANVAADDHAVTRQRLQRSHPEQLR